MALTPQQTYLQQTDPGAFLDAVGVTQQTNPSFFQYDPGTASYMPNNAGLQYAQQYGTQYSAPVADQSTNAGGGSFTWADGSTGHQYGVEGPFPGTPYSPTGAVGQAWLTAHGVAPGTQWEQIPPDVQAAFQQYIPTVAPHAATGLSALLADPGVQMLGAFAGGTLLAGAGAAGGAVGDAASSLPSDLGEVTSANFGAGADAGSLLSGAEAAAPIGVTGSMTAPTAVEGSLDTGGLTPLASPTDLGEVTSANFGAGADAGSLIGGAGSTLTPLQILNAASTADTVANAVDGGTDVQAPAPVQDDTGSALPGTNNTIGNAAQQASALQRILNGTATAADYITAGLQVAPGIIGAISSSDQASALQNIANQQQSERQPFLDKATQYLNDPSSFYGSTEGGAASQAILNKLSVGGNPAQNPTSLAAATSGLYGDYQGALSSLANIGLSGQTGIVGAGTNAVNQSGQTAADLGSAVSNVVNPQTSLAQLLQQLNLTPKVNTGTATA